MHTTTLRDPASAARRTAAALRAAGAMLLVVLSGFATGSQAISLTERNVLIALYNATAGANWTTSTNWNGAVSTECTWYGITCNAGNVNVVSITLPNNKLIGSLPSTLNRLTALQSFIVNSNTLGGSIPSLAGMTALQTFHVYDNQLSGTLPSLNGLTALQSFNANGNALTGSIAAYSGLANLQTFFVGDNNLTGTLPSLAGYPALQRFGADGNALTGAIPSLSGLSALRDVYLRGNQLSGGIPTFTGLGQLRSFYAGNNQLTGSIPSLSSLTLLEEFDVQSNQLIGSISSLANLSQLRYFRIQGNQFTGPVPAPPSPTSVLMASGSSLCPNRLSRSVNTVWDAATGITPWSYFCVPPFVITQSPGLALGGVTLNMPADTFNVVLTNKSVDGGTATNCTFGGTHAGLFSFYPAPVFPLALPASQAVNLPVRITASSTGAKTATLTCVLSAGGSLSGGPTALTATVGLGCLDADGDGDIDAATDGVILARAALGFTGVRVTSGAIVGTPPRNSWALIRTYLNRFCGTDYAL